MRWYTNPDDVERHPWRASLLVFGVLFIFWSAFSYFALTNRGLAASLGIGALISLGGVVGMWRGMHNRRLRREGRPRDVVGWRFGIDSVAMGAGAGVAVFGITSGSPGVIGSGVVLAALGVAWYVIKRSVSRR